MKSLKLILSLLLATALSAQAADVKISQLPLGTAASTTSLDSFPYVSNAANITKRLTLYDIANIPSLVSLYAPLANPTFTGTVHLATGVASVTITAPTFIGNLTGTATTVTTNANLTGPITSVGNATSIASQTGTGSKIVVDTSPTLVTPVIGAATGTSLSVSGQFTSTVSTGTPPLVVSSTTQVANLNAATAGSATTATTASTVTTNANMTGDVTSVGNATTIAANAVTNAKAAQMAAHTYKGNNTGSTANSLDLTSTQVTADLNAMVGDSGSGGTKGLVPAPASGDAAAGKFLKADGTWTAPPNAGTVTSVALTVPSFLSISGSPVTSSGTLAISLSGTALPVANGGTGAGTFTAHGVMLGNSTSAMNVTAAGTAGQVLRSGGASADPTFQGTVIASMSGSTTALTNGTDTKIVFTTVDYDPYSAINVGKDTFTVPANEGGYYMECASAKGPSVTETVGNGFALIAYKGGVLYRYMTQWLAPSTSTQRPTASACIPVPASAGDTLQLYINMDASGGGALPGGANNVWVTFSKID